MQERFKVQLGTERSPGRPERKSDRRVEAEVSEYGTLQHSLTVQADRYGPSARQVWRHEIHTAQGVQVIEGRGGSLAVTVTFVPHP